MASKGRTGRKRKEGKRHAGGHGTQPWVQSHAPEPAGSSPDDETSLGGIWEPEV